MELKQKNLILEILCIKFLTFNDTKKTSLNS